MQKSWLICSNILPVNINSMQTQMNIQVKILSHHWDKLALCKLTAKHLTGPGSSCQPAPLLAQLAQGLSSPRLVWPWYSYYQHLETSHNAIICTNNKKKRKIRNQNFYSGQIWTPPPPWKMLICNYYLDFNFFKHNLSLALDM